MTSHLQGSKIAHIMPNTLLVWSNVLQAMLPISISILSQEHFFMKVVG